jgi:hypothetical protein
MIFSLPPVYYPSPKPSNPGKRRPPHPCGPGKAVCTSRKPALFIISPERGTIKLSFSEKELFKIGVNFDYAKNNIGEWQFAVVE